MNVKVLNLISRTNETRYIKWHKTFQCKCTLDQILPCNNKQRQYEDKWRFECKELVDKVIWNKRFILNPSNCKNECDK